MPFDDQVLKLRNRQLIEESGLAEEWSRREMALVTRIERLRVTRDAAPMHQRMRANAALQRVEEQLDDLRKFESGFVGEKQPDAVEVLLGQGEIFVWDATRALDDPLRQDGEDVLRTDDEVSDDDGSLVAHATLELAHHAVGMLHRPSLGRLTDHDRAVVPEVDDRRHGGPAGTQLQGLTRQRTVGSQPADGRGRVTHADIDAEHE